MVNEEGMLKMHDVIHKFASYVAFRDHNDGKIHDWPSKAELEHFSAISLPFCDLPPDQMLPVAFDNPKLESFILLRNEVDASLRIPDNFFEGMKGLKLMDLNMMSLSSVLVSSLSALVQLRTLCLGFCELSVIGELPMLQPLNLFGSSIVLVPKEIGKLGSTLKLLDLRRCEKLERIAAGVIFRLTLLEDLRIAESSYKHWERLEGNYKRSSIVDEMNATEMASMEEFKKLQNLINLEIDIIDHAKMFPKDLFFTKLETFKILFGDSDWKYDDYIPARALKIAGDTIFDYDSEGTKALMTRAESLLVKSLKSSVIGSEMDPKGLPELKHLKIEHSHEIQYVVMKNDINCIFPKLEVLIIYDLCELERICDVPAPGWIIWKLENYKSEIMCYNEGSSLIQLCKWAFAPTRDESSAM